MTRGAPPERHLHCGRPGCPSFNVADDAQTSRPCFRREAGALVNAATGAPFSWRDACVEKGPPVHMNPPPAAAERDVLAFLKAVFAE
jgi:hypothetical protein